MNSKTINNIALLLLLVVSFLPIALERYKKAGPIHSKTEKERFVAECFDPTYPGSVDDRGCPHPGMDRYLELLRSKQRESAVLVTARQ